MEAAKRIILFQVYPARKVVNFEELSEKQQPHAISLRARGLPMRDDAVWVCGLARDVPSGFRPGLMSPNSREGAVSALASSLRERELGLVAVDDARFCRLGSVWVVGVDARALRRL